MLILSNYILQEKINSTRHVDIYRGLRQHEKHKVLIKILDHERASAETIAALQHEFYLLKQLNSNGIAHANKIIHAEKNTFLELENIEGTTLKDYLTTHKLSLNQFFYIALQMVDIVGVLHEQRIIHKNIHPSIFMIDDKLKLTLMSLSLSSQLTEEIPEYINLSQFEDTLNYISPEQTGRMNRPIDFRTDFYSLGIVFYEMLSGHVPFQSDDPLELVHFHIAKIPSHIVKFNNAVLPVVVNKIIEKLLEKMPEDRYASVVGLKTDLLKCADELQQQKEISQFALAKHDIHDHLHISHQLYGRQSELKQLLEAFKKTSAGGLQFMLIAGYSGIGKTSLVREIHKPIVQYKGYFIQGKFDQLLRDKPYSAIVNAFQILVKQILASHEKQMLEIKRILLATLGDLGQVIIDVIPEVELIIGKQPIAPELNPAESKLRFNIIFKKFVSIFAKKDHPLVLFLDDLQWADTASLELINNLLIDPEAHYLLIIGAYRDNEVTSDHPLMTMIEELKKMNINVRQLTLQPLKEHDVTDLLFDSLNIPKIQLEPLVTCIYKKTQGNPFFINEFLKIIYQQGLLFFSYESQQWQWNLDEITKQKMMDNVIDLLTKKIKLLLGKSTQELLKLAACIGHQFDLKTLSIISKQNIQKVGFQIWEAIQANLILPLEDANKTASLLEIPYLRKLTKEENLFYQFAHDRIQQTAYEMMPTIVKSKTQVKIGRLLLKEQPLRADSELLFEVMDHFNQSLTMISDYDEKLELAKYNLWAGMKAKKSSAYQAAKNYLQAGINLLSSINWNDHYELIYSLHRELSICKYLTGEFEAANAEFKELLINAKSILDKIAIYQIQIQMLSTLNKHTEAIAVGREALSLLKIKLPKKANTFHILMAVLKIKLQVGWQEPKNIKLSLIKHPEHQAAIDLIAQLLNNAFISDQPLFVWLACTDVSLSLKYGYTESTLFGTLVYAFALIHALDFFSEGFSFVDLYSSLKAQYGETNLAGKNHLVLGTFIDPWRFPLNNCLQTLLTAHHTSNEVGDIVYSNYCNVVAVITAFALGKPLTEVDNIISNSLFYIERSKINDFQYVSRFWKYSIELLNDKSAFSLNELSSLEQQILTKENKTGISFFYSKCTKICYILGYFSLAESYALKHRTYAEYALGILSYFENEFYYALLLANKNKLSELSKIYRSINHRFEHFPTNFEHYSFILQAELERIKHNTLGAVAFYEKAIISAQKQNMLHIVAIANECAGRFFITIKAPKFAKQYFLDAYIAYKSWGALAKCKQLEAMYPEWFMNYNNIQNPIFLSTPVSPTHVQTQTLDMLAILKFTQAISNEIYIDKLLQKLLHIVLQEAAAQRCVILLLQNKQWVIEAEEDLEKQQVYLISQKTAEEYKQLPLSLINYVERTKEPIIIEEAMNSELTFTDPYVQRSKPQSLLMVPLIYQGQLRRILYLENKSSSQVFTSQHLQSLILLASQAIISLENAYLYYQVSHDPMTGIANRSLLYQMFQSYSAYFGREKKKIAILFLDLDYFKTVNDTLGHDVGDQLIIYLANLFKKILREGDLIARLGGDEFVIMLTGILGYKDVILAANRIYQQLMKPIVLQGHEFWMSTSMGVSLYPNDGQDIETLLKRADIALYRSKETGRNKYQFYSSELEKEHQQAHAAEREIRRAFDNNEFILYYQPIFSFDLNRLLGVEALLRWQHPEKGLLQTEIFIEILEKSLLMDSVGKWVLQTAIQQAKKWYQKGILNVPVAINVSVSQFKKQSLSRLVKSILQKNQLKPGLIELELTETAFIENDEKLLIESQELQKLGVHLVLDDFGTGYSNLTYLKRVQVSKIKIDRTFVQDSQNDLNSKVIIQTLIGLAHCLNLQVIAEGVENEEQINYLREQRVDGMQGFYLSHPLSTKQCEDILTKAVQDNEQNDDISG